MKSILVADNRSELLATLEPILKHWGYRVLSTRKVDQVMAFLQESSPCLLILGEGLLSDPGQLIDPDTEERIKSGELPLIILKQEDVTSGEFLPGESLETLDVPVELFELYSFIQRRVEHHPRQNLRLRIKIPGMYRLNGEEYILADALSLSMCGLFFKATARIKRGDRVSIVFPLIGHGQEIEVDATVLYTVQPGIENNFFQGFGVVFEDVAEDIQKNLRHFIREHFLREVSAARNGVGDFTKDQLRT